METDNLKENPARKLEANKPREIYLPHTGISYICSEDYYPVFLEAVSIANLIDFRKKLENQIEQEGKQLVFWSYNNQNKIEDRDAIIDCLRVRAKDSYNSAETVFAYNTKSDNSFLSEFLKRATELYVLGLTFHPANKNSLKNLNDLVDDYLKKHHTLSFDNYLKTDLSELLKSPSYRNAPGSYLNLDFLERSRIYLGALASMNRDLNVDSEEFFSNMENKSVFLVKRKNDEIFEFVRKKLIVS